MILNFVFLSLLPDVSVDSWRIKTELDYLPTPPPPPAPPPPLHLLHIHLLHLLHLLQHLQLLLLHLPHLKYLSPSGQLLNPKTPNYLSLTLYIRLSLN